MGDPFKTKINNSLFENIGKVLLPVVGWRVEGDMPPMKCVLIVAPHTSNWDMPIGLICANALGILAKRRYGFMMKASAFGGPLDPFMKSLGGIPVQREAANDMVKQFIDLFKKSDELMLVITPEGTRKHRPYWKSGFYRIALGAKVPIAMAYLDYKRKVAGVGPSFMPTGYISNDLDIIRKFYASITAKFPESVGTIDFRAEDMLGGEEES